MAGRMEAEMTTTIKTTTGHTLTIDTDAMLLRIAGDLDTMEYIPEREIDAACAAEGVRCTYDAVDSDAYRLAEATRRDAHEIANEHGCDIQPGANGQAGLVVQALHQQGWIQDRERIARCRAALIAAGHRAPALS